MAYRLSLSESIFGIHDVFHVSQLRKCQVDVNQIIDLKEIELEGDMSYEKLSIHSIEILDQKIKELRNKMIRLVKLLWRNHYIEEAAWEKEEEMRLLYPALFG